MSRLERGQDEKMPRLLAFCGDGCSFRGILSYHYMWAGLSSTTVGINDAQGLSFIRTADGNLDVGGHSAACRPICGRSFCWPWVSAADACGRPMDPFILFLLDCLDFSLSPPMASSSKPLTILFKHASGIDIYMDVYLSPSATQEKPAPCLLWWHGGGLLQGSREDDNVVTIVVVSPHHLRAPETHNITFISADYRLAPQFRFPVILSDCADAIQFLHSEHFKKETKGLADTSQIILSGSSAGGWLSLLCGCGIGFEESGVPNPPPVQGIIPIYPITDLEDPFWTTKQTPVPYFGRFIAKEEVQPFIDPNDPTSHVASSPLDSKRSFMYPYMLQEKRAILSDLLLSGTGIPPAAFSVAQSLKVGHNKLSVPPVYIVHGDQDTKVPVVQSRDVVEALKDLKRKLDIDYEYEELKGIDHLYDREPECEMEAMYQFIKRVFKS
ncbi:hypothetical protein D9757_003925 [Collybiopsis confluens]|uniref:Alpha/beta-hydrolase n=1 Tax=Collybiopsis confluens TaxID=2823264 RepID=A0A8H5HWV6_9AGAR|nr:hypothetical protein D9757_003925 [Collybiopsis confluens]